MIGQLIRAVIYGFLFMTIGLPLLIFAGVIVPAQLLFAGWFMREMSPDSQQIRAAVNRGQITTGMDATRMVEHMRSVRATVAAPEEAQRNNRTLHIAVVEVTGPTDRRVYLDVEGASNAAMLVIADDPINWVVKNASPLQRAKLAFETPSAFGIIGAHKGLIAGIRSGAFGARNIVRPRHMTGEASGNWQAAACQTLQAWAEYFGVDPQDVGIWHFTDPVAIGLTEKRLKAVGGDEFISRTLDMPCGSRRSSNGGGSTYRVRSR